MQLDPLQIQIQDRAVVASVWINKAIGSGELVHDLCLVGFDVLCYSERIHSLVLFGGGADEGSDELIGFYAENIVCYLGRYVWVESCGVGKLTGELHCTVVFWYQRPATVVCAEEPGDM